MTRSIKHEYDYNELDHMPLQTYLFSDTGKYIYRPIGATEMGDYRAYPIDSLPENYRTKLLKDGKCPVLDRRVTEVGLVVVGVLGYLHLYCGGI